MAENQEPNIEETKRTIRPRLIALATTGVALVVALVVDLVVSSGTAPAKQTAGPSSLSSATKRATPVVRHVPSSVVANGKRPASPSTTRVGDSGGHAVSTTQVGSSVSANSSNRTSSPSGGSSSPTAGSGGSGGTTGGGSSTPTTQPPAPPTTTPTTQPQPPPTTTPTTQPGVHGSVNQTFTNSGAQWDVLTEMGSLTEPGNAARGEITMQLSLSGCPTGAQGQNAGFVISWPGGSYTRANIGADGGGRDNIYGPNFGPGMTFGVQTSCAWAYFELDY